MRCGHLNLGISGYIYTTAGCGSMAAPHKVEVPEMSATSTRRIHRGKSRLGSITAGYQQTADPPKARRSKILFRVIAASGVS